MKGDVEDRLVDHALRELNRPSEAVDLSERIAEAWTRGERGPDLSDVIARQTPPAPIPPALPPTQVAPSRWRTLAKVAAVVVVGLGIAAWFRWRSTSTTRSPAAPIAAADTRVRVFRQGQNAPIETAQIRRGDVLVLDTAQSSAVTFANQARVVLAPCSIVGWTTSSDTGEALALQRGRLEIATGKSASIVDLGFARAAIEPESRVSVQLFADGRDGCTPIADAVALEAVFADGRASVRRAHVRVDAGALLLARQGPSGETDERIAAGDEREVWNSPDRLVFAPGSKAFLLAIADLVKGTKLEPYAGMQRAWQEREASEELAKSLLKEPQYWSVVRQEARELAAKFELDGTGGHRLIDFLLLADVPQANALVRELWPAAPAAFREDQIVVLAERGWPEFEREVRAMVDAYDPSSGPPPIWAAASLAIRVDRDATELLTRFLADAKTPGNSQEFDRVLIAAYTLDAGGDANAWARGMDAMAPYIEDLVRRGAQPAAVTLTLCIRLLHEARAERRLLTPRDYFAELTRYLTTHAEELATAGDVRAALEKLKR